MSKENETRKKYEINFEEHAEFSPIGAFKLITSTELAELANEVFVGAFKDFEGLKFEPPATPKDEPTFTMYFNHGTYPEEDENGQKVILGVTPAVKNDGNGSTNPVEKLRRFDNMISNGAKYLATEDLKDVVETLLTPPLYKGGNIKWNQIVSELSIRNQYNYNSYTQYTIVKGISISRLAALIFGDKIDDDHYDYTVNVLSPINAGPMGGQAYNWILQINRASSNEVAKLYKSFGCYTTTDNIIRKK